MILHVDRVRLVVAHGHEHGRVVAECGLDHLSEGHQVVQNVGLSGFPDIVRHCISSPQNDVDVWMATSNVVHCFGCEIEWYIAVSSHVAPKASFECYVVG